VNRLSATLRMSKQTTEKYNEGDTTMSIRINK